MSYTPTIWATGDTIEATDMNKIENGIAAASGGMVVNIVNDDGDRYLDKSFTEIYTALKNNVPCYLRFEIEQAETITDNYVAAQFYIPITVAYKYNTVYRVYAQTLMPISINAYFEYAGTNAIWAFGSNAIDGALAFVSVTKAKTDSLDYSSYLPS